MRILPIGLLALVIGMPCFAQDRSYTQKVPGSEIRIDMVAIPGDTFLMGSPPQEKGRRADEGPQIRVRMDPFYMSKFEIDWQAYKEFSDGYARVQRIGYLALV